MDPFDKEERHAFEAMSGDHPDDRDYNCYKPSPFCINIIAKLRMSIEKREKTPPGWHKVVV